VSEALLFLAHAEDRERAKGAAADLVRALPVTRMFKADPAAPGYGLDALSYAPAPDAFAVTWLDPMLIREALDHLEAQQAANLHRLEYRTIPLANKAEASKLETRTLAEAEKAGTPYEFK
jgi:hypothetical protein